MKIEYFLAFLTSFVISLLFVPLVFSFSKKINAKQTILHYVKEHASKSGTSTMGGLIFIIPAIIIPLMFFTTDYMYAVITLVTFFSYGLLGFLDDFIKVYYKQNLGLKPYQKIIGQLGISLIVAIFVYKTIGSEIFIPFTTSKIDLGLFIIPLIVFIFVATVNSVNLIDGLDGLCSSVSINYLLFFALILLSILGTFVGTEKLEIVNLCICIFSLIGSIMAFLVFNTYPAKIFMGDTGSLAIGGFITCISVLTKMEIMIAILGFAYVLTAISDIIQVLHYKRTKRRIFKMAPLHHHFQMSGIHENKIVFGYFIVTFILNLIVLTIYIF